MSRRVTGVLRLAADRPNGVGDVGWNGVDDAGWPWFDVDGLVGDHDGVAIRYSGRAHLRGERFHGHAVVDGIQREVEFTIAVNPHGCGRGDCGLRRDPDRGGELYYARLVCGHGDWPCAEGCRRPVHPVERCPGVGVARTSAEAAR